MTTVEHEALPGERQRLVDRIADRDATIARLEAEVERKDAALRFYADRLNWISQFGPSPATLDGGKHARDVLFSTLKQETTDV